DSEGIASRLAAGRRQQHEEEVELGLAERLAIELDGRKRGPHILGRPLALLLTEPLRILEELDLMAERVAARERAVRIERAEQRVGCREQPFAIFDGDADDVGDHVHRKWERDLTHEVEVVELERMVDQSSGPRPALRLELSDHARREAGADE